MLTFALSQISITTLPNPDPSFIGSISMIEEMAADLHRIETDGSLRREAGFTSRAEALDFIDFHILGRIEALVVTNGHQDRLSRLRQQAEKLRGTLEDIDRRLFEKLGEGIRDKVLNGAGLKAAIIQYTGPVIENAGSVGYDELDHFINGMLWNGHLPEQTLAREPGMVHYQKTPARIIFELERRAQLTSNDVFVDLGSGLGQVVILVGLLTDARCIGIEYEPAYHRYAEACAGQLRLSNVHFINENARDSIYDAGTVFYLYTSFEGPMLDEILDLLKAQSETRPIRLFTYGPCSLHVAGKAWLSCKAGDANDTYQLCEFHSIMK